MAAKNQRCTLSDADLMAVGSHGIARSYPKNTIIVTEGDKTDSLYVILELLAMMAPTLLLLAAVAFSMAFPGRSVEVPVGRTELVADLSGIGASSFDDMDTGIVSSAPRR